MTSDAAAQPVFDRPRALALAAETFQIEADALLALNAVTQAQERWRAQAPDYASDLVEQLRLPPQSPAGHYRLALADSSATGYAVDARAQGDQADDQRCALMGMRLDNGRLTRVARDHLGRDSSQDCWPH